MSDTVFIVLSIFGLIGIGYLAARSRLLSAETGDALADFVFTIAIPLLLFRTLARADFHGVDPWRLWLAYFAGVLVTWTVAHMLVRRVFGRDARSGVVAGVSAGFGNTVLIGIPLVRATYGEPGMVAVLILVSVHLPVMMAASLLLNTWARSRDGLAPEGTSRAGMVRGFLLELIRHPIVLGILAGGLWHFLSLPIPALMGELVDSLADIAGPLALFACGMGLARYGIARNVPAASVLAAMKLVVMPAVVLVVSELVGLSPLSTAAMVLVAASPTGVNAFLIANRFGTGEALASNATLISSAGGVATVSFWLFVVRLITG
ncbi:AEC family transporter [Afifella sp. IM 167]|uniref:AEC family transporter n=1 Tax=Afifella sp. IM 167 TaxID=2033586 RepID=UPI001CC98FB4|nr:AEC family transporter [Afifella sp. IM 167]MBZ8132674.1 transporter [Afifella sp. IM 167]